MAIAISFTFDAAAVDGGGGGDDVVGDIVSCDAVVSGAAAVVVTLSVTLGGILLVFHLPFVVAILVVTVLSVDLAPKRIVLMVVLRAGIVPVVVDGVVVLNVFVVCGDGGAAVGAIEGVVGAVKTDLGVDVVAETAKMADAKRFGGIRMGGNGGDMTGCCDATLTGRCRMAKRVLCSVCVSICGVGGAIMSNGSGGGGGGRRGRFGGRGGIKCSGGR